MPDALKPSELAEGYAFQRAYVAARGGRPIGYKVAATNRAAQQVLGIEAPFYGRLFDDSSVLNSRAASWPAEAFQVCLIEPEFAVRLGQDLPARSEPYRCEEIEQAVASLHPAIEIIDSAFGRARWTSAGAASLIADNAAHGAFLLGPGTSDVGEIDLARHEVSLAVDGQVIGRGCGANALGHPFNVLAWLAGALAQHGETLRAGDLVTTGVVTPFIYLEAGQTAQADFGLLGSVAVRFEQPRSTL